MIVVTDNPLALLVALGVMSAEEAERIDALTDELATSVCTGELTREQAGDVSRQQALADASKREPS